MFLTVPKGMKSFGLMESLTFIRPSRFVFSNVAMSYSISQHLSVKKMRSKIFASCLFTVALGAFQDAFSLAAIKRSGSSSGNTSRVNVESE